MCNLQINQSHLFYTPLLLSWVCNSLYKSETQCWASVIWFMYYVLIVIKIVLDLFFFLTGSFAKVKSNHVVEAEPSELHFSGFEVGNNYKKTLVREVVRTFIRKCAHLFRWIRTDFFLNRPKSFIVYLNRNWLIFLQRWFMCTSFLPNPSTFELNIHKRSV